MILLNQTIPNNPKPSQTKPNQTKPPQTAPDFLHFLSLVAQSWHSYRVGSDLQIQTPVSAFLFVWNVIWVRVKIWHIYVLQWEGPVLAFLFVCNIEGIVICVYRDMATTEKRGLPDQKKDVWIKTKDLSDQLTHYVPLGRQVALNPVLKTGCLLRWKNCLIFSILNSSLWIRTPLIMFGIRFSPDDIYWPRDWLCGPATFQIRTPTKD